MNRETGAADTFADLAHVHVGGRGVDVPITEAKGFVDHGGGDVRRGLEDAEPRAGNWTPLFSAMALSVGPELDLVVHILDLLSVMGEGTPR